MDYTVFKAKILTKSSIEIANASLFEILYKMKILVIPFHPGPLVILSSLTILNIL